MTDVISINPDVMHGAPCFAGTRVPVQNLFDALAHNRSIEYFLEQFPSVQREQVLTVLHEAAERLTQNGNSAA